MGVISFASLKGGVGKTSVSINVAQAFAHRGCRTLLLDLDPSAHATRFFSRRALRKKENTSSSPISDDKFIKLLLSPDPRTMEGDELGEALRADGMLRDAGPDLQYLPGGNELRHVLVGRGAKAFAKRFPHIIHELRYYYDHIVIDTAPDFNIVTRNALALSDLAVVPVDPSEMSIHSLEELLHSAQHLRRPTWVVLRTMVNKKAQRTKVLSEERLQQRLIMRSVEERDSGEAQQYDIENPYDFMRMLQEWERDNVPAELGPDHKDGGAPKRNPLYLLRSLIYRTEQQNQLSFTGMTAFDSRATAVLGHQYLAVARELESLVTSETDNNIEDGADESAGEDSASSSEPALGSLAATGL